MKLLNILFLIGILNIGYAQKNNEIISNDISVSPFIDGTILTPESPTPVPLLIIIGGSGPTDRNGNQQMMVNNSLKFIAEDLYKYGIATFRYDKRIVKQMKNRNVNEENIRFDDFIKDAIDVIEYFKKSNAFSKIYVLGHSQGSTVGMVAIQGKADGFISVSGPGQSIDNVVVDQLSVQAPGLKDNARQAFNEMRATGKSMNYSEGLSSIFRPSIQPFMLSWMLYDPQVEIVKLEIPVLIVSGDKDLQVQLSEGEALKQAKPNAEYVIIENMNHVLKEIKGDDIENSKSYNEYNRPLVPNLIEVLSTFILK
jgi:pimeloyl-ACP methyl ester carboxylesterase